MPQSDFWPFGRRKPVEDVDFNGQSFQLQKQLGDMEGEVKEIQMELAAIRRNRQDVRKNTHSCIADSQDDGKPYESFKYHDVKHNKEDNEVSSLSKLREDLIRAKNAAEQERFQRLKYEGKLKDLEVKLNDICSSGKANSDFKERKIAEEELVSFKTQVRDLKEQIEEMKITDDEKTEQLQEYRVKYLQAQQQVEELKRQLDVMEFDNKQASDQIQLELQKMKMQFQEKLLELAPLPDLLKGSQIQLQEAKQLQKLAEDNAQQISNEMHRVKEKLVVAVNSLNQEKIEKCKLHEENCVYREEIDEKQSELDVLEKELEDYKCKSMRFEEKFNQLEARYNEKAVEYAQLSKNLEELKDESTRTLNRFKDRSESGRHNMQSQIAGLERQLITCRAQCRSYQKERDEIRQRMQIQVHNLKEEFDLVNVRLRGLLKQVSLLKHCYSISLPDDVEETSAPDNYTSYSQ